METAQRILERKGYQFDEIDQIVSSNDDSLDWKTREKFGCAYQPVHLWESYYIGDADEDELTSIAKEQGYSEYQELLIAMDRYLLNLAEEYDDKQVGQF